MKKEEELKKEIKIDTLDIAIEAKKLSLEDKERLYFMIKGMQLSLSTPQLGQIAENHRLDSIPRRQHPRHHNHSSPNMRTLFLSIKSRDDQIPDKLSYFHYNAYA